MTAILVILGLSIVVQLAAAVLAAALHWTYGRRWAWTFISIALSLMAVRRCVTLHRLISAEVVPLSETLDESAVVLGSSVVTLGTSILMLSGVALIGPVFRKLARAETLLTDEKERLQATVRATNAELELAGEVQQRLLPIAPPRLEGFDLGGVCHPARAAGGDYFDYIPMSDGHMGIVIADVSGHGLGPALLMAETRAYLHALAALHTDIGEILTRTNRFLSADSAGKNFVTLFFAQIEPRARGFLYASAGHQGYLLKSSGEVERLDSTSPPLAVVDDMVVACAPPKTLETGDLVVLLTDGIAEARSPEGAFFGIQRALNLVRTHADKSASDIAASLREAVREFSGDTLQSDDLTAVIIKVQSCCDELTCEGSETPGAPAQCVLHM